MHLDITRERMREIEPPYSAWEDDVLTLLAGPSCAPRTPSTAVGWIPGALRESIRELRSAVIEQALR